jgi:hypothetical protein
MDNYYSSSKRKFWDFILGFVGAIVVNTILLGIVVYLMFTVGDIQWLAYYILVAYPVVYILEFVASWFLIKKKRRYIFIGVLVVLALMLIPLLLSGACFAIFAAA